MNPSASFIYGDYDIAVRVGHGVSEATLTDMTTGRVAVRASLPTTSVEAAMLMVRDYIDEQGHRLAQANDYKTIAENTIKGKSDDAVRALIKAFRRYDVPEYQAQADALESALSARQKTSAVQHDDYWVADAWDSKGETASLINKLFDTGEIPQQGVATPAAEPLRLIARIIYDVYNNGWGNNLNREFSGLEYLLAGQVGAHKVSRIVDFMRRNDGSSKALAELLDEVAQMCVDYYYANGGTTKVGKTASYTLPLGAPFDTPGIVDSAEQARDIAISWQHWMSDQQDLSMAELVNWEGYFESLVEQFPELREEFIENAIIGGDVTASRKKRAQWKAPSQVAPGSMPAPGIPMTPENEFSVRTREQADELMRAYNWTCPACEGLLTVQWDGTVRCDDCDYIVEGKQARTKAAYSAEDKIDLEYARLNNFKFMGIYLVSRHYGGTEEGGWWYDWSDHVRSFPLGSITQGQLIEEMKKAARETGANVQYDRFSVLGNDGDIIWAYEERPGEWQSNETPRYE